MTLHISLTGLLVFLLCWAIFGGILPAVAIATDDKPPSSKVIRLALLGPAGWLSPLFFWTIAIILIGYDKLHKARHGKTPPPTDPR